MTTSSVATAAGVAPSTARRVADRFARRVETPRGAVWEWPAVAPNGEAWSPEVWTALVGTGGRPRREG